MADLPNKYDHLAVTTKWQQDWEQSKIYRYDPSRPREETFVVDTPPPTVSGSLHIGHVFSYTQTDTIVRYRRMRGMNIMYPMGWDDNGLATERRVQNKFNVRCNPSIPYNTSWKPNAASESKYPEEISRQNFIEACSIVTHEDEVAFEDLWRTLGLSVDWTQLYATIDAHCRTASQASFLELVEKGFIYANESPTMWDVDFQTALAQADLEDRTVKGAYHDIRFGIEGGGEFTISTTRPELLVACIAVVAHPSDERYRKLFGKNAITPLYRAPVPICPSEHADPEKGTGIMMICTFGDIADVDWWKASGLPIKQVMGNDGKLQPVSFGSAPFHSVDPSFAQTHYGAVVGKSAQAARKLIAEQLAQPGSAAIGAGAALVGAPRPIEHPVKFYEKGERPIEFITTRQWFIRLLDHKEALVAQGAKVQWFPSHMQSRYTHWVEGLNHDWCISRQRFFGVPFPVWYPISVEGRVEYDRPIFASSDRLPVDPLVEVPAGYKEAQRDKPGGFCGDRDVMDTWATSSLTPQIVSHWKKDSARHGKLFPSDLRPQAHEIIRTWAFYTIAKAWMHEGKVPWDNIVISGWILDPDRKKMSKSKGNVVTPKHLLEQYSADGVRYWAARARLGVDTAFDEKVFKNGQKLATKLFNAGRFVLSQVQSFEAAHGAVGINSIATELDRCFVDSVRRLIEEVTTSFDRFDYASALQLTESAFWAFCDHYLELVKIRAYSAEDIALRRSAVASLNLALRTFLKLFAPFMPYVTEEIWSWHYPLHEKKDPRALSIHTSVWPTVNEIDSVPRSTNPELLAMATEVLTDIRSAKSEKERSLGWPVERLEVIGAASELKLLRLVIDDLQRTGKVRDGGSTELVEGSPPEGRRFATRVTLGEAGPDAQ